MKIINKKARFNYELLNKYETGIVLTGPETKSCKLGHLSLKESYVKIIQNELWLIGANINPYKFADNTDYDPIRSRKLLMHRHQIQGLQKKIETANLTLVPTAIYTKKRQVKLEIALARGKKQYQKKEVKKHRDLDRETQRIMKKYS